MRNNDPPIDVTKWEEVTKSNLSVKEWKREYECEFLGTGDTYIEGEILGHLLGEVSEDFRRKYNNRLRIWKDPDPIYEYVLAADVSLGRQMDYSAFHIFNLYNGEQVAEFYSNKTPINEFSEIISKEGSLYNDAYVYVERNTIGANVVEWLYEIYEYPNIWSDDKGIQGLLVNQKNREENLAKMEEALRTKRIRINSKRTVDELLTFIITDRGKIEADAGKHDDLIDSLSVAVFGINNILSTTPIEFTQIEHKARKPFMPSKSIDLSRLPMTSYGGVTEEDVRWLLKS